MTTLFYAAWFLLTLAAVLHLLLFKREPSSTVAWLLFVTAVPILGAILFLVFGPQRLARQALKRKKEIERLIGNSFGHSTEGYEPPPREEFPPEDQHVLELARRISEYEVTSNNHIEIFATPHQAFDAMREAIDRAQKFIHLEYYIIQSDEVTRLLFDSLAEAAKRGVEVRLLYDALGSIWLKRIFLTRLTKAGAKVAGFLPFSLLPQRLNLNFRNHRKILICDGKEAFTGGTNIGKEYLGRVSEKQWHDYTVRVIGPCCNQLQDVFAKDWHFTTQEDLFSPEYYPESVRSGASSIQVLESGPDSTFLSLHQAIFLALNSAREEILLTTPYFIPDPSIVSALTVAALRGVRVKLILPSKSDSKLVQYAGRSFYDNLLKAGVMIYEYQPRILHAKLMVIDGKWTMLGSANMDIRSFRLNFELNLLVYGPEVSQQAKEIFQKDIEQSEPIELESFMNRSIPQQMLENACRVLSPIL